MQKKGDSYEPVIHAIGMNEKNFSYVKWKKYNQEIFLLLKGELTDWEKDFLESIRKSLNGYLSDRQEACLRRIIQKYFGNP